MNAEGIDESLQQRLQVLRSANEITPLARALTEDLMHRTSEAFGLSLREDNAAAFATHVALAISRIERGEALSPPPSVTEEELAGRDRERLFAERSVAIWADRLQRPVPPSELTYLRLHIATLLEQAGKTP